MDHASFGVEILFEEGMIRQFVKEDTWDGIIRTAIARHSDYCLDGIRDERELLHARIIRDADKLDNCRVKLEDSVEAMLGVSAEEVGRTKITTEIMQQFEAQMSYLAYFYDINFNVTYEMIEENHFVDKLVKRIPYEDSETAETMEKVRQELNTYIHTRAQEELKQPMQIGCK